MSNSGTLLGKAMHINTPVPVGNAIALILACRYRVHPGRRQIKISRCHPVYRAHLGLQTEGNFEVFPSDQAGPVCLIRHRGHSQFRHAHCLHRVRHDYIKFNDSKSQHYFVLIILNALPLMLDSEQPLLWNACLPLPMLYLVCFLERK